jgi:tetratricopeptide (TPR) repeat protein
LLHCGRITDSLADVELALAARGEGWEMFLPSAHAVLAWNHIERGELDAAQDAIALADNPAVQENLGFTWLLEARGRLHLASGRAQDALDDFLAAGKLACTLSMAGPGMLHWRSGAARAANAIGDADHARALADEDLALSRHVAAPGMIGRAIHTLGLIDTTENGLIILEQAADTLAQSPAGLEHAHTLVDLGAARRRRGQRTAAQEPLRRGLALAEKGAASALRTRSCRARSHRRAPTQANPHRGRLAHPKRTAGSEHGGHRPNEPPDRTSPVRDDQKPSKPTSTTPTKSSTSTRANNSPTLWPKRP